MSQGIPMLTAGDELLRSAACNNNTWCQNNPLGWIDWSLTDENADMLRFVRGMIALRRRHRSLRRRHFLGSEDIRWYGAGGESPRWDDPGAREVAFTLRGRTAAEPPLHVMMNVGPRAHTFALPAMPDWRWAIAVNTAALPPGDVVEPRVQTPLEVSEYRVGARSVLVLEGLPGRTLAD
jgi:glycogen operon protein